MKSQFELEQVKYFLHLLQDGNNPKNFMYLMKLLFLADRWHLRHYGVLMTNDVAYGMKNGSILSQTYDFLKEEKGHFADDENLVEIDCPSDFDISKSQERAIAFSLREFSKLSQFELGNLTHAYPEWDTYSHYLNASKRFKMDVALFFLDPSPSSKNFKYLNEYCKGKDPFETDRDLLEIRKNQFIELQPSV